MKFERKIQIKLFFIHFNNALTRYCTFGAASPRPESDDNFNISGCMFPNGGGGKCEEGFYCPQGSGLPTPCDAGMNVLLVTRNL